MTHPVIERYNRVRQTEREQAQRLAAQLEAKLAAMPITSDASLVIAALGELACLREDSERTDYLNAFDHARHALERES